MPLDSSELSSLSGSLDDLVRRLRHLANDAGEDDETGLELREVERQLEMSSRRLAKVLRRARR